LNPARTSLRLAFAGTPEFAVAALDALHGSPHRLIAVFTQPDRPAGRGRALQESAVKRRARELGLPVHQPASFRSADAQALLGSLELDACVVVAYGLILPAEALAAPRLGCFNIHASLLPRWRGAAPIQRALLAGDAVTGVCIMRMETGLDTGPVLARESIAIGHADTAQTLHDRLAALGARLIVRSMDALAGGEARETPQSGSATYAAKIDKAEARIAWSDDAEAISRRVRAFNPWPVAETRVSGVQLRIWEAETADTAVDAPPGTVLRAAEDGIDVACGRGVLRITRLQLAGRRPLSAGEFSRAQPLSGARLGGATAGGG
jgi:methionyl-tRNA formyltransferase